MDNGLSLEIDFFADFPLTLGEPKAGWPDLFTFPAVFFVPKFTFLAARFGEPVNNDECSLGPNLHENNFIFNEKLVIYFKLLYQGSISLSFFDFLNLLFLSHFVIYSEL